VSLTSSLLKRFETVQFLAQSTQRDSSQTWGVLVWGRFGLHVISDRLGLSYSSFDDELPTNDNKVVARSDSGVYVFHSTSGARCTQIFAIQALGASVAPREVTLDFSLELRHDPNQVTRTLIPCNQESEYTPCDPSK